MSNAEIVEKFFRSYLKRDFQGMHACLAEGVRFSDYAFEQLQGDRVRAMWQWFCTGEPKIDMLGYKVLREEGDRVTARYRIRYFHRSDEKAEPRKVEYMIASDFRLADGKIVEQQDSFYELSEFDFAKMRVGLPKALLAHTPAFRMLIRREMSEQLAAFIAPQTAHESL